MNNDPIPVSQPETNTPPPPPSSSHSLSTSNHPRNWIFVLYYLPLIITLIGGAIIQSAINTECVSGSNETSKGICDITGLLIFSGPLVFIVLPIVWLLAMIGTIHLFTALARGREQSERKLFIITGVLLGLIGSFTGFFMTISWFLQ